MPAKAARRSAKSAMARWTPEQVKVLTDTVASSRTAREAFVKVGEQLGKSPGTVQQKYYALQRAAGKGRKPAAKRGRKAATVLAATGRATPPRRVSGARGVPTNLGALPVDELVSLARDVKAEVDRRRRELEAASRLFG